MAQPSTRCSSNIGFILRWGQSYQFGLINSMHWWLQNKYKKTLLRKEYPLCQAVATMVKPKATKQMTTPTIWMYFTPWPTSDTSRAMQTKKPKPDQLDRQPKQQRTLLTQQCSSTKCQWTPPNKINTRKPIPHMKQGTHNSPQCNQRQPHSWQWKMRSWLPPKPLQTTPSRQQNPRHQQPWQPRSSTHGKWLCKLGQTWQLQQQQAQPSYDWDADWNGRTTATRNPPGQSTDNA